MENKQKDVKVEAYAEERVCGVTKSAKEPAEVKYDDGTRSK